MKTTIYKVITYAFVAALVAIVSLAGMLKEQMQNNARLSSNFNVLMTKARTFQTTDSLNAISVEMLELDRKELELYNKDITNELKTMGLKVKNLERYSAVSTQANYHIKSYLRDSLHIKISRDSTHYDTIALKYFDYSNDWISLMQTQIEDSVYTIAQTRDSIVIAQTITYPFELWFMKFGKPRHREVIKNYNPYSTVRCLVSIEQKR